MIQSVSQQSFLTSFSNPACMLCRSIYAIAAHVAVIAVDCFVALPSHLCHCTFLQERWVFRTIDTQYRSQLITSEMHFYERLSIIHAMTTILVAQRNEVTAHLLQLFTPKMDGYDRAEVIRAYGQSLTATVPAAQRDDLLTQMRQLLNGPIDPFNTIKSIKIFMAIPVAEKNDFIQHWLQLITPEMEGKLRTLALERFATIPAAERGDFVAHVHQLITPEMGDMDRLVIIECLAGLPADQRARFV